MSLKTSQITINFQTVKSFKKSLNNRKGELLHDTRLIAELFDLKKALSELEDMVIESRSKTASKALSQMTEEERRMLTMAPKEKKFFLEYKSKNPENPWGYFKEYQRKLEKEYKQKQKKAA